jgi:hypothetical protein
LRGRARPWPNVPGFRRGPPHPVADNAIEHFAANGDYGIELLAGVRFAVCGIESDRGHGGLLTNLAVMMCR